ncbi:MAG: contractile injection system protein, VgrG/Pvc8 family [Candidatus Promineifilaceae bacterium]|nr:contractile injection system protein, VgrG/Pvc8 family [Candidatus Promineifilaceae bacterium]
MPVLSGAYVLGNRLTIDGSFAAGVSNNVEAAFVEETIDGLYRCEIELAIHGADGYLYFDRETFDFGSEIELSVLVGSEEQRLFRGVVTGMEGSYAAGGGARLTLLAEDRLQDLRMTRRTRTFEDISDEDVMRRIAEEHSLQTDFDSLQGPTHRVLAQTNLSDLAFLRRCARRLNAELWLEDDALHAAPRPARGEERLALAYGAGLQAFVVRADLAHQCTELIVGGWDPDAKEAIRESADESAVSSELNGSEGGSAILADALGERVAAVVHTVPLSAEEARAVAQARYRERARRFVTGEGIADGDPRIRVGTILQLSQLGSIFDGDYYVVRTRHHLSLSEGYNTEFAVERAGVG